MGKSAKTSGVIRTHGHCLDCAEKWSGGQTAMQAIRHHEATGHRIRVEQVIWWEWHTKPPDLGFKNKTS
jgi:hypothetical protein